MYVRTCGRVFVPLAMQRCPVCLVRIYWVTAGQSIFVEEMLGFAIFSWLSSLSVAFLSSIKAMISDLTWSYLLMMSTCGTVGLGASPNSSITFSTCLVRPVLRGFMRVDLACGPMTDFSLLKGREKESAANWPSSSNSSEKLFACLDDFFFLFMWEEDFADEEDESGIGHDVIIALHTSAAGRANRSPANSDIILVRSWTIQGTFSSINGCNLFIARRRAFFGAIFLASSSSPSDLAC